MEDALRRAKMSVQPLKPSDTVACPGTPRCPPILKSSKPVRRCPLARSRRALVRSRATVEARPTPSGKPRHAHSPDRLPVNFSADLKPSKKDLKKKRKEMAAGPFPFLRATYWRWAEMMPSLCQNLDLGTAPHALAVGDSHLE